MTELLQFSIMDMTPYDQRSWFNLIGDYNRAVWWAYLLAVALALVGLRWWSRHSLAQRESASVRLVLAAIGASWCWTSAVFHMQYLANLNWAAPWFGWAFILQGCLLLLAAALMKSASWVSLSTLRGRLGQWLLLTGLLLYPLSSLLEGRNATQLEWFPLSPAPVTLVSMGVLVLLNTRWRHALVIIPVLWAAVSSAFAVTLGLMEVYFMVGAVVVWLVSFLIRT
ncbi:hypothetical protein EOL70_10025 [Leucothrix sargassi]|nr:hypothetical protein EOL70_10025 [Leucothrix sargassi]